MQDFLGWLQNEDNARIMSKVQAMKHYFPYIQKIPDNVDRIRAQHFLTNADFKNLLGILNKHGINPTSSVPLAKNVVSPSLQEPETGVNPFGQH